MILEAPPTRVSYNMSPTRRNVARSSGLAKDWPEYFTLAHSPVSVTLHVRSVRGVERLAYVIQRAHERVVLGVDVGVRARCAS